MNPTRDSEPAAPPPAQKQDASKTETLTDLIDRMDREAFRRSLELRKLRVVSSDLRRS